MNRSTCRAALALAALLAPGLLAAQQAAPMLDALQDAALARDPRGAQRGLLTAATAERLESLRAERLPQFTLGGTASWQSDVTAVTLGTPGLAPPRPPRERWQATLDAEQLLLDGGRVAARREVERARLAEALAGVSTAQYARRGEVNAAFFSAWLAQQRAAELGTVIADLEARVTQARARVEAGTALPADTARLRAAQLEAEEQREAARAERRAALEVLALLTGVEADGGALVLPELGASVAAARAADAAARRDRPEFAAFAAQRARIDREMEQTRVENRPRAVAFAQGGVGRPGLNQFATEVDPFATVGVRVEWRPWTWGSAGRAARALAAQRDVVATEEQALAEAVARLVRADLAEIDRLSASLDRDARLVALREQVERAARAQFDEGALTAADYVEARTDLLQAALEQDRHRAELAQAQATYLTTLGLPPR